MSIYDEYLESKKKKKSIYDEYLESKGITNDTSSKLINTSKTNIKETPKDSSRSNEILNKMKQITSKGTLTDKDKSQLEEYKKQLNVKENKTTEPIYSTETLNNKYGELVEDTSNKWFKKGEFKDGYQFGDISKTAGKSIGDVGINFLEGVAGIGEGIGNLLAGGVAQVADWIGQDEYANRVRNNISKNANPITNYTEKKIEKPLDKGSVFADKSDELVENIGQMAGYWAAGEATGVAAGGIGKSAEGIQKATNLANTATMFSSAAGSSLSESYSKEDVDDWQAWAKAAGSGTIEAVSEKLFGWFGAEGGIDKQLANKISGKLTNGFTKLLARQGIQATAEGTEELVSYGLNYILDNYVINNIGKADFSQKWNWEDVGEQFGMAALSSLVTGTGIDASNIISNKSNNTLTNAIDITANQYDQENGMLSINEQKVYNNLLEKKTLETKTQKTIDNMIEQNKQTLRNLYGSELTQEQLAQIKEVVNQVNESGKLEIENTKLSSKEKLKIENEIKQDLEDGNLDINTIRDILGENVDISKDILLQKSLYENNQKYNDYQVETTGNEKVDKFLQSAADAGVNNTTKTRKRIELISKLVENTDRQYKFVNQEQLKELGYNENANGLNNKETGEILLSVNSNKEIVAVVGHETTHLFDSKVNGEYTQEYKDLQNAVVDYLKANGTYESKIDDIMKTYQNAGINLTQDEIMEEVTADTIGDNLFGDNAEQFIQQLTSNRNVFQKIYDYIKKVVNNIKGYDSEEARQIQNLKDKFEKAYKTLNDRNNDNSIKYSVGGIKAIENIKSNPEQYNSAINSYNKALEMIKDNKTNKEIYNETGWFRGDNGKLKFNFSDADMKLINQQYDTKKTYNLEDILEHKTLFEFYPELKEYKVKIRNLSSSQNQEIMTGGFKENTKTILLNKKIMNNQQYTEGTLIHEIQHAIQGIEGFTRGSKSNNEFLYYNSKGELEAEDTTRRMIKEKYDKVDLSKVAPKSANFRYSVIAKMRSSWYDFVNKIARSDVNAKSIRNIEETTSTQDRSETNQEGIRNQRITLPGLEETSKINNNTKYSLSQDNQGRTLTKEQQEYFKDSKARDEQGNLIEVYHGTNEEFNIFDKDYLGTASGDVGFLGDGFYLATHKGEAGYYGSNIMNGYVNIKNPFNIKELNNYNGKNISGEDSSIGVNIYNLVKMNEQWRDIEIDGNSYGEIADETKKFLDNVKVKKLGIIENSYGENTGIMWEISYNGKTTQDQSILDYTQDEMIADSLNKHIRDKFGYLNSQDILQNITYENRSNSNIKSFSEVLQANGYDSVVQGTPQTTDEILIFNSNQFKNIDNVNPTENEDIRYSMTQGETDQYWKKIDKNDLAKYNTIESEVGNNGEQQVGTENGGLQEKPNENMVEGYSEYYERVKQLYGDVKKGIGEQRKYLDERVKEQLQQLPISKTKSEKFIRELANNKIMTKEDVRNFLNDNNTITQKETDEYLQQIRKDIGSYNFKLSDTIKSDLKYKYGNIPRNIRLNNNGLQVDQIYQELNNKYPDIFSAEISNPADQADLIIDFMRSVNPVSTYETKIFNDEELDEASLLIYAYKQNYDEAKNYYEQQFLDDKNKLRTSNLFPENIEEGTTPKKLTRKMVREQIIQDMGITVEELETGNDISAPNYQLTDPIRVNEKVFGRELGKKINDLTINQTKHNTAEKIRWQNKERAEIEDLGIKARSKESAAVQKYGEKQYVDKNGDTHEYGDTQLAKEFPNIKTQGKIKKAAEVIRGKYDTYIEQINEVLTALGYDAIPKRTDYMRHFQELGDIFSQTGVPFNLNDMKAEDLPTDINGLTEFNKPGKNWFAQAQKRYGNKTTYDAITGIDGYLEGAGNLIYHTQDIQNYRALSGLIRDTFGSSKGFQNLENLTDEQALKRIEDIQSNKLSKYVAWLDEQANSLAGKKGAIDRGVERALGRRVYTFFDTIKKQVGSNMTGLNVRSSLTNLISTTIASAKTNKIAMVKGTVSTINNMFKNDDFINKSDFLTARFGSDQLSPKLWQKLSNAGQIFMTGTDYFTSNIITRSKYYEGLQKGMNESDAIKYADDFAARVMGDRSQGSTAEAFNSKTLGLLTQFQLETNNQWQYMIHDTKMDFEQNSKTNNGLKAGATALFQMGQLAAYSYLFNELFEKLTGSRAAFDPVEIFKKIFGLDDEDEEKTLDERIAEAGSMLVDNIPFGNLITGGGRIPISEALTGVSTLGKKLTGQSDKYGNKITWEDVKNDTLESLPYYLLPTGYGQIKKTTQGLKMYNEKNPVSGSYTDSGNLRYTVDEDVGSKLKAGIFGAWANPYAQDYIDSGYKTINAKNIDEMVGLNMNSTEYRKFKTELNSQEKTEDKLNYINESDLNSQQKNLVANNLNKNSKSTIDMSEYGKYNSYDEYKYARDNPNKYSVISQIDTYDNYNTYKDKISDIKKEYSTDNGYTTAERKSAVQKYIEGLNLGMYQKMMLEKMAGGYSIKSYSNYIQEYLDSSNLTESEKYQIWEELFN